MLVLAVLQVDGFVASWWQHLTHVCSIQWKSCNTMWPGADIDDHLVLWHRHMTYHTQLSCCWEKSSIGNVCKQQDYDVMIYHSKDKLGSS